MSTARSLTGIAAILYNLGDQLDGAITPIAIPAARVSIDIQFLAADGAGSQDDRVAAVNAIAEALDTIPATIGRFYRSTESDPDTVCVAFTELGDPDTNL